MKRMVSTVFVIAVTAVFLTAGAYRLYAADTVNVASADMSAIFQAASGDAAETRAPQYPFPAQGQGEPYAYPGAPVQPGTVQQNPQYPATPQGSVSLDGSWAASAPNGGQVTLQFQGSQYQMSMNGGMDYGTYQIQGNMIAFQSTNGGMSQFAFAPSPDGSSFQMGPPQNPQSGFVFQRMGSAPAANPTPAVPTPYPTPAPTPTPQPPIPTPQPPMPAPPQTSNLDGTWAITLNGQTRFIMISGSALAYLDAQGNVISASTFYTQGSTWHETFQDGRQFSTQFQLSPDGRTLTIVMNNGQTGTYQKVQ